MGGGCFDEHPWKCYIKFGVYLVVAAVVFMLLYFGINQLFLTITKSTLSDYQGVSDMGKSGLAVYFSRAQIAYHEFFLPSMLSGGNSDSMFPMRTQALYFIVVAVICILSVMKLWVNRHNPSMVLRMMILMFLIPLVTEFIFVMVEPAKIHQLMTYGQAMIFVYLAWLLEGLKLPLKAVSNVVYSIALVLMLVISALYVRYDNACYLKAEFQQERAISYFTALVADIKGAEGYKDELPVVYINSGHLTDNTVSDIYQLSTIRMMPLWGTKMQLNDYAWQAFMNYWCAWSPKLGDASKFENLEEVQSMPSYPDQGSIKVVEDTVIVKF